MTQSSDAAAKWGKLAGLLVDAALSHHASHCEKNTGTRPIFVVTQQGQEGQQQRVPEQVDSVVVTKRLGCTPSWTGTAGEVMVPYSVANPVELGVVAMYELRAGENLATASHQALPAPHSLTAGDHEIVVTMPTALARGLYLGRLRASTGAGPDLPVVIYLDGVP